MTDDSELLEMDEDDEGGDIDEEPFPDKEEEEN